MFTEVRGVARSVVIHRYVATAEAATVRETVATPQTNTSMNLKILSSTVYLGMDESLLLSRRVFK